MAGPGSNSVAMTRRFFIISALILTGCGGGGPTKDMIKSELESRMAAAPISVVSIKSAVRRKTNYFYDVSFEARLNADSPVLFDGRSFRKYSEEEAGRTSTYLDVINQKVDAGEHTWVSGFSYIKEGEEWSTANWRLGQVK